MSATDFAYVDTSCAISVALREPGFQAVARRLETFPVVFSSNLLEAELRATLKRENAAEDPSAILANITWVFPPRALTSEFRRVLDAGYLRGADLWHLGCALSLGNPADLVFMTLDQRQAIVAQKLGFAEA